jgi:hypothetical protein
LVNHYPAPTGLIFYRFVFYTQADGLGWVTGPGNGATGNVIDIGNAFKIIG